MIIGRKIAETRLAVAAAAAAGMNGHGIFPGACVKQDGTLALLMVAGSDFESADQELAAFAGSPDALEWREVGGLGKMFSRGAVFSATAKPAQRRDGVIVALGYGFERTDLHESISGYTAKNGGFPPIRNAVWFSHDGGIRYSREPHWLDNGEPGLEISGPALPLRDGRLLAFGAPFNLNPSRQIGMCLESTDGGMSWHRKSIFFDGGAIAPWECRGVELGDGRIAVVFWAFDLSRQRHLTNRLAISGDGGQTWQTLDTRLPGQAANLLDCGWDDGDFGLLQARREADAPGIYLSRINLNGGGVNVRETVQLCDARGQANASGGIVNQFPSLKFGQPALHRLCDGSLLLIFWCCNREGKYETVLQKFAAIDAA